MCVHSVEVLEKEGLRGGEKKEPVCCRVNLISKLSLVSFSGMIKDVEAMR